MSGADTEFLSSGPRSFQIVTFHATFLTGSAVYVAELTLGQDLPDAPANTCFADAVVELP